MSKFSTEIIHGGVARNVLKSMCWILQELGLVSLCFAYLGNQVNINIPSYSIPMRSRSGIPHLDRIFTARQPHLHPTSTHRRSLFFIAPIEFTIYCLTDGIRYLLWCNYTLWWWFHLSYIYRLWRLVLHIVEAKCNKKYKYTVEKSLKNDNRTKTRFLINVYWSILQFFQVPNVPFSKSREIPRDLHFEIHISNAPKNPGLGNAGQCQSSWHISFRYSLFAKYLIQIFKNQSVGLRISTGALNNKLSVQLSYLVDAKVLLRTFFQDAKIPPEWYLFFKTVDLMSTLPSPLSTGTIKI